MLCVFCKNDAAEIAWDETSHLGKRLICYTCITERDTRHMRTKHAIILYEKGNVLTNIINTLRFKIIKKQTTDMYVGYSFMFNKRRWIGVAYPGSDRVMCRKVGKENINGMLQ